jgi:hypothetical protein
VRASLAASLPLTADRSIDRPIEASQPVTAESSRTKAVELGLNWDLRVSTGTQPDWTPRESPDLQISDLGDSSRNVGGPRREYENATRMSKEVQRHA